MSYLVVDGEVLWIVKGWKKDNDGFPYLETYDPDLPELLVRHYPKLFGTPSIVAHDPSQYEYPNCLFLEGATCYCI